MSKIRQRYDEEFKKNAVKLSYATAKKYYDHSIFWGTEAFVSVELQLFDHCAGLLPFSS
jgi:hypothetical protein